MKKLVTALMVVLPLILFVALFAVTSVTRIAAEIPANGISIANKGDNGIFNFDIADYESPMFESDLGVEVTPLVAHNREYSLTVSDAETGEASNLVTRNDDGSFALNDIGKAKLTYTSKDGGYTDSVIFNISSSGVLAMNKPSVIDALGNQCELLAGDSTDYIVEVENGIYQIKANLYPANIATAQPKYKSRNQHAVVVNEVTGRVTAQFAGNYVVEIEVPDARGNALSKTIEMRVQKSVEMTINGKDAAQKPVLSAPLRSKAVTVYVDAPQGTLAGDVQLSGANLERYTVRHLSDVSATAYAIDLELEYDYQEANASQYNLKIGGTTYRFTLNFVDLEFFVYSSLNQSGNGAILTMKGTQTRLSVSTEPDSDVSYTWSVAEGDEGIIEIASQNNAYCEIIPRATGRAIVRIECKYVQKQTVVEREIVITQRYTSILFGENSRVYGMGRLAIANSVYENNALVKEVYQSAFVAYDGVNKITNLCDIDFTSSNNSIVNVINGENGIEFNIKASGLVTITAECKYADILGVGKTSVTFNAVDGVNVYDYRQLVMATQEEREVVLANDIYLGEKLYDKHTDGSRSAKYDSATMRAKLLAYTSEIKTTADWTYYKNLGYDQPTVRYCFEFRNNFYGNGHVLNGEYLTNTLDSNDIPYDYSVFKGPLDFVATSSDGIKLAAVKAQDNIVFLVRKDNIKIDNTILKGCDDETLYDGGTVNLSLLNNMGTTLEIMSKATLTNSRVMNGRTVVRIFGRDNVDKSTNVNPTVEKLFATIDGCVLQNAREYTLKIGTNRCIKGDIDNCEPQLYDQNGKAYKSNSSACDDYVNDEYFMNNYVLTDVVLKDSVLRTSGLFTIGIESHFAGPMLADSAKTIYELNGWHDLAATSYPCALHLVGKVVLADWKKLSSIDSSTLIETSSTNGANVAFLNLKFDKMLAVVKQYDSTDKYKDIIADKDGEEYVHGGIVLYGGGRNYSVVDMSQYTFEEMRQYNINIRALKNSDDDDIKMQGQALPLAAGTQDFRFIMFDASSEYDYDNDTDK